MAHIARGGDSARGGFLYLYAVQKPGWRCADSSICGDLAGVSDDGDVCVSSDGAHQPVVDWIYQGCIFPRDPLFWLDCARTGHLPVYHRDRCIWLLAFAASECRSDGVSAVADLSADI